MQPDFCSIASATAHENLFATTPHMSRFILIEYPYPWQQKALENSRILSTAVKLFLDACIEKGQFSRIFLVKNSSAPADKIRLFLVENCQKDPFVKQVMLESYDQLESFDFPTAFSDPSGRLLKPMYLVCTHGKVDMCCSKFGIPLYQKLLELGADTWQCTHVTGDRFAPNIVQVPYGHYYGHITLTETTALFETLQSGRIYTKYYRGRSCYTKPAQAAEHFLRRHLSDDHYDSIWLINTVRSEENLYQFIFRNLTQNKFYQITISHQQSESVYFMNCKAEEKKHVDDFQLRSLLMLEE